MNKLSIRSAALTFTVAVAGYMVLLGQAQAQAQPSDPASTPQEQRVDHRQARQAARIASGADSGQLTPHEQRRLARQQAKTAHMERKAESDGQVTRREALRLEHQQDHNSRAIRRQKHDAQTQPAQP